MHGILSNFNRSGTTRHGGWSWERWVVHDMTHISQVVRVMAKRYDLAVGPWKEYLSILSVKR